MALTPMKLQPDRKLRLGPDVLQVLLQEKLYGSTHEKIESMQCDHQGVVLWVSVSDTE